MLVTTHDTNQQLPHGCTRALVEETPACARSPGRSPALQPHSHAPAGTVGGLSLFLPVISSFKKSGFSSLFSVMQISEVQSLAVWRQVSHGLPGAGTSPEAQRQRVVGGADPGGKLVASLGFTASVSRDPEMRDCGRLGTSEPVCQAQPCRCAHLELCLPSSRGHRPDREPFSRSLSLPDWPHPGPLSLHPPTPPPALFPTVLHGISVLPPCPVHSLSLACTGHVGGQGLG